MNKDKIKTTIQIKQYSIHLTTLIGIILVLAGVSLASFPYVHNMYYQWMQERQLEQKMERMQQENENVNQPAHSAAKRRPVTKEEIEDPAFVDNEGEENKYAFRLEEGAEGILEIPAIGLQQTIGYEVELSELERGPGFYPESNKPDSGNVSIAGHRTTYGAPFRNLDQLEKGDIIKLYYQNQEYSYEVDRVSPTDRYDWSVIEDTDDPALTLTTCEPPGSSEKRLIVRAYLK